jgi:hypothetical protein
MMYRKGFENRRAIVPEPKVFEMLSTVPRNVQSTKSMESLLDSMLSALRSSTLDLIGPYFDKDSAQIILHYLFVRREWRARDLDFPLLIELRNFDETRIKSQIVHLDCNKYRIGSIDGKPVLDNLTHNIRSVYYAEYVDLTDPGDLTNEHCKMFVQLRFPDTPQPYFAVIVASGHYDTDWFEWQSYDLTCYISRSFDTAMEEFFLMEELDDYVYPPLNDTYTIQQKRRQLATRVSNETT